MSNNQILKRSALTGAAWRFMERIGVRLISFIVSLVLARLLSPAEYGIIAVVQIFISLCDIFIDKGLSGALIQKKAADELDFSTAFYMNMLAGAALYLVLFFCAPLIADFYDNEVLIAVVRVKGLTLFLAGFLSVVQAYASRKLLFKKFFYSTLAGTGISAAVGIAGAFMGLGVWALVLQSMTSAVVNTAVLAFTIKWRPKLIFSLARLKGLYAYGWKLLVTSFIATAFTDIRALIISAKFSAESLAFYQRGARFPGLVNDTTNGAISAVMFPVMSKKQDSPTEFKRMLRRFIKTSTYLMFPCLIGLAVIAEPMIRLILTEKWLACVPFLQLFCVSYLTVPLQNANLQALNALGRTDLTLKLEMIKKTIALAMILVALQHSLMAVMVADILYSVLFTVINALPNRKLIGYSYVEQLRDILPNLLVALMSMLPVYFIGMLGLPDLVCLALQVGAGVGLYWLFSRIFRLESLTYIRENMAPLLADKRHKRGG